MSRPIIGDLIPLKEEASGNATASDILFGKTATTGAGEITGTLIPQEVILIDGDTYLLDSYAGFSFTKEQLATEQTIGSFISNSEGIVKVHGSVYVASNIVLFRIYIDSSLVWSVYSGSSGVSGMRYFTTNINISKDQLFQIRVIQEGTNGYISSPGNNLIGVTANAIINNLTK